MDAKQITTPQFWRAFAPEFHIGDSPSFFKELRLSKVTPDQRQALTTLIRTEGYFQGAMDWGVNLGMMADRVRALSAANLSPVFAFIYDEFWIPFLKLHDLYLNLLGGNYYVLPDFWIWNVDPKKNDAGWPPHRDMGRLSLLPDGSPKSLTTWIPLSAATTLNGCMYIVPACFDPTYGTDDDKTWKFELPSIRALPGNPGDFFVWNQAVLHWGSKTSRLAPESRVSMAFEFQRADIPPINQPLMPPLSILPFESRLKLIAKQILQYRHMYKVDEEIEKIAIELVSAAPATPVPVA
jgi:hypothetical protein